jgi:hypothetical protein
MLKFILLLKSADAVWVKKSRENEKSEIKKTRKTVISFFKIIFPPEKYY